MPKISVLLTSYNHADYIGKSLQSILNQTFHDYELIIIDDGSTDRSMEVIHSFTDERIRIIQNEENTGFVLPPSLIAQAHGKYIAIAHSDDLWAPDKLEKQYEFLEKNPEYGLCFTQVELIDEVGEIFDDESSHFHGIFTTENRDRHAWLRTFFFSGNQLCHPSLLIRTEMFQIDNFCAAGLRAIPDFYKWVLSAMYTEIYIYPEKLTYFRVRENDVNTSAQTIDSSIRSVYELWHIARLYTRISSMDDMLKIFPETKQYCVSGKMVVPFALARMCLDHTALPMYRQLGLDVLFSIMQDEGTRALLKSLYGYTIKSYYEETGKNDIYHFLTEDMTMSSSLFWDAGEGISPENCVREKHLIKNSDYFSVSLSIPDDVPAIKALRFDPDEGTARRFIIKSITADGEAVSFRPSNGEKDAEWDVFYTTDPIYLIDVPASPFSKITIVGKTRTLKNMEMELFRHHLLVSGMEQAAEIDALKRETQAYADTVQRYEQEIERMHQEGIFTFPKITRRLRSMKRKFF